MILRGRAYRVGSSERLLDLGCPDGFENPLERPPAHEITDRGIRGVGRRTDDDLDRGVCLQEHPREIRALRWRALRRGPIHRVALQSTQRWPKDEIYEDNVRIPPSKRFPRRLLRRDQPKVRLVDSQFKED